MAVDSLDIMCNVKEWNHIFYRVEFLTHRNLQLIYKKSRAIARLELNDTFCVDIKVEDLQ